MPFVKVDTGMLDSTLWFDLAARNVFLTALLMAEPFEVTEPMPQYEVSSLKPTGWYVPPGWYGFVRAAGKGIVSRSLIEHAEGMAALSAMGESEAESRSADFDGRRLVRVDGGYIVLNFFRYRERDYTSATRSKRYRENLKLRRGATESRRDITQAEAEAEAEAEDPSLTLRIGAPTPTVHTEVITRTYSCPEDLQPLDRHRGRCEEFGLKVDDILAELKLWEPDRPIADWHKALDRFVATAIKNRGNARRGKGAPPEPPRGRPAADVLAEHRRNTQAAE